MKYFKCTLEAAGNAHKKVWAMQEAAGWPLSRLSIEGSLVVSTWTDDPIAEALLLIVLHADKVEFEMNDEQQVKTFLSDLRF